VNIPNTNPQREQGRELRDFFISNRTSDEREPSLTLRVGAMSILPVHE